MSVLGQICNCCSCSGPDLQLLQLFWPRSAVIGSSSGFALVSHAFFHFLPIPFLALSGYAFHVLSYSHRMQQCVIRNCQFSLFLVCHLNHNLSILSLISFSIHRSGADISQGFLAVAKKFSTESSEDLISPIKLGAGTPRHSPLDLGVAAGEDDRNVSVRFRVL